MDITIPDFALILLIAPDGCGAADFAARSFTPAEVLVCRGCHPDQNGPYADLLDAAGRRLAARELTVIDSGSLHPEARKPLLALARQFHAPTVALVFDLPPALCAQSGEIRPEELDRQLSALREALPMLESEGYRHIYILDGQTGLASVRVSRQPLPADKRGETGPFDLIGDVHGCATELELLLERLGYTAAAVEPLFSGGYNRRYVPPPGRKAIFIGDLVDRGPRILDSFQLARAMVEAGNAFCVLGNHDDKLLRMLRGNKVSVSFGLEKTVAELDALSPVDRAVLAAAMQAFFADLPSHLVLDGGRLVAAHAGIRASMIGRESRRIRDFTLYGETTGEKDEFGLPVRRNWAARYQGGALVVYGHVAVEQPEWVNHTVDIDTGCVYGGSLTALRYPEMEIVQVPAQRVYRETLRPLRLPEE